MQDLKLALVQTDIHWHDIDANLKMLDEKLKNISSLPDIIILPEMFSTGFTMDIKEISETMDGKAVNWMLTISAELRTVVIGSIVIEENQIYYNRLICANPNGDINYYDKRHLFSMAGEEKVYCPGIKKLVFDLNGWKICPMVCYDLRFPEWVRNQENYDLLVFSANWPEKRISHWRKLLQARAIENQCFVAGVNRIGTDKNDILYDGNSMVIDPMGEIITEMILVDSVAVITLGHEEIKRIRRYMPFLADQDKYKINI
jgi:predicted amidohydrolase